MRFVRICAFVTLILAVICCFDLAEGAPAPKKKNKTKKAPQPPLPAQFQLPPTPLPNNTTATGTPVQSPNLTPIKTVDKEVEYDVSDEVRVQKLQKFTTGLNFVPADLDEVEAGQKVTLSLV